MLSLKKLELVERPHMFVHVGSTNPVKVNAVKKAFSMCQITVESVHGVSGIKSGVSDQPIGWNETERGAKNRALGCHFANARSKQPTKLHYCVGLEGGLVTSADGQGLDCVAVMAIYDVRAQRMSTARTASFALPPKLTDLVRGGMELGDADDLIFQRTNSKQEDGTVGILTNGVINRTDYYVHALVMALVPIMQPALYVVDSSSISKASWWQRYSFQLRENPIFTKSCTSNVTTAVGAAVGQLLQGGQFSYRKVFAYGLFGQLCTGPIIHYWTTWMARSGPKNIFLKTIMDRLVFHPPFQYAFFVFTMVMQGKISLESALVNTNGIIFGVVKKALMFWPPMMYMIFNYSPVQYQSLFSNMTAFAWSTYLGWASK